MYLQNFIQIGLCLLYKTATEEDDDDEKLKKKPFSNRCYFKTTVPMLMKLYILLNILGGHNNITYEDDRNFQFFSTAY